MVAIQNSCRACISIGYVACVILQKKRMHSSRLLFLALGIYKKTHVPHGTPRTVREWAAAAAADAATGRRDALFAECEVCLRMNAAPFVSTRHYEPDDGRRGHVLVLETEEFSKAFSSIKVKRQTFFIEKLQQARKRRRQQRHIFHVLEMEWRRSSGFRSSKVSLLPAHASLRNDASDLL